MFENDRVWQPVCKSLVCCLSRRVGLCSFGSGWSTTALSKPRNLAPRWLSQLFELESDPYYNEISGYGQTIELDCTQHFVVFV